MGTSATVCTLLFFFFFFNDTATTEIYTLSLHDALPISGRSHHPPIWANGKGRAIDVRSEEHTSELQSRGLISYAVFCLKKTKTRQSPRRVRASPPAPAHPTWRSSR